MLVLLLYVKNSVKLQLQINIYGFDKFINNLCILSFFSVSLSDKLIFMKSIIYILLFISFNLSAQQSFIIKNDGSRIDVDATSVRVITTEKILVYKEYQKNYEKTISFNDFETAFYSGFKLKILKLNGSEKDGYFILSECKDRFLVSKVILTGDSESDNQQFSFQLSVIDEKSKTLESFLFNEEKNAKSIALRNLILPTATKYFPNCDDLLNRFNDFNKRNDDVKNLSILGVFHSPVYYACN